MHSTWMELLLYCSFQVHKYTYKASVVLELYLSNTLGTPPVTLGYIRKRRNQAEGVIAVITSITQQQFVLVVSSTTK